LVAKAHKVHERLEQVTRYPERLRPKDSGDIALLMMVSEPNSVVEIMRGESKKHPEIAEVVEAAAKWLVELYADSPGVSVTRQHAADSLAARFTEDQVFEAMDTWLEAFCYSESVPV
jgi:hypothetical protein